MIGDRLLTDITFANRNGMVSVLVMPLSLKEDHPVAIVIRFLETSVILPLLKLFGVQKRRLPGKADREPKAN